MKILVTGASGLLGRAICREFHKYNCFETIGIAYSRIKKNLIKVNLLNKSDIDVCVEKVKPDCIIHCAVIRDPDVCEKDPSLTKGLNINSTQWIADAALKFGCWMIHISSDYV
ncbi:MAG: sugar nucleotide-binding protein, partial [Planctomycetota bacterium]|nr:sugar nucleotide-binding protein [Planctomycetota bacterium]